MNSLFAKIKYFDKPLLLVSGLLLIVGLAILYSVSVSGDNLILFYRQSLFALAGVVAFWLTAFYNYHNLGKLNRFLYPAIILALILVLIFSPQIRGSARWINFGPVQFQPGEFAKLIIVVGLSRWLYLKRGQINSWKSIFLTLIYTVIPASLVLFEPDLGTTMILAGIWLGILLISSINKKFIFGLALLIAVVGTGAWNFVLKDYQKGRVETFLNPNSDPRGRGYNVKQAVIAVGSGQLLGKGFGRGLQSSLKFLPERYTDFIFASAGEEIGFVGSAALLILYVLLFMRLVKIMSSAKDDFGFYLVGGVLFMIFGQVIINLGVNMGLLPVTGIPLPFLTYGGNTILVTLIALGIVQNVAMQSKTLRF